MPSSIKSLHEEIASITANDCSRLGYPNVKYGIKAADWRVKAAAKAAEMC
jgi:hypothetical protein